MIKITATGGVLSIAKDGSGPQFTDEELKELLKRQKDYGMHTAAHAGWSWEWSRAVLAGITTIEHGTKNDAWDNGSHEAERNVFCSNHYWENLLPRKRKARLLPSAGCS